MNKNQSYVIRFATALAALAMPTGRFSFCVDPRPDKQADKPKPGIKARRSKADDDFWNLQASGTTRTLLSEAIYRTVARYVHLSQFEKGKTGGRTPSKIELSVKAQMVAMLKEPDWAEIPEALDFLILDAPKSRGAQSRALILSRPGDEPVKVRIGLGDDALASFLYHVHAETTVSDADSNVIREPKKKAA